MSKMNVVFVYCLYFLCLQLRFASTNHKSDSADITIDYVYKAQKKTGASAEYIADDGLEKSTVSRTFKPELNIDEEKNEFYDCPGYADTRNETAEIGNTYRNSSLQQVSYTNFGKVDFGFPLSAETKLKVTQIVKDTIGQITSVLSNVDRQLLNAIQQKIQSIDNFHSRFDALKLGLASIGGNEPATLNECMERLKTLIRTYGITSIDMNQFNQIIRHENNLNILKSIADGTEITAPIRDLIAKSSTATKYQTIEHRWYSFLVHVFTFFSNYEVQKDVSAYNVANLAHWGQINKPQGLTITAQTFAEFVKRFPNVPVNEITPTAPRLKELNDIVGATLRSPVQYTCNGDTMTINGNIGKCADIQVAKCAQIKVKKINVYLLSTFYADADINLPGMDELKIYAPKWSVQSAVTFNLNGINGVSLPAPPTPGTPGKPGGVGSNGANFFGYANEMVNGELLTVTSNGGNGANGQSGTTNADVTVQFANVKIKKQVTLVDSYFSNALENAKQYLMHRGFDSEFLDFADKWRSMPIYRLHARCCGVTGQGGGGGLGGHPGFHNFIHNASDAKHMPKIVANVGLNGQNGANTTPCKTNAAEVACKINQYRKDPWRPQSSNSKFNRYLNFEFIRHISEPRCPDILSRSHEPIAQQLPRLPLNIDAGITAYKTVLVENMNHFVFGNLIQKVFKAIETI